MGWEEEIIEGSMERLLLLLAGNGFLDFGGGHCQELELERSRDNKRSV